ncbi:hypothetical protein HPP92_025704 [Vanilla planifolia]|uniref:Uncharacterized protein n=1 Tax=Vanilla planifolia TaxID=51239 RepID=A0A835U9L4_VANPL|nr:hypothetical protein HPP92_025704 [Vanilla planifolia]
MIKYKLAYKRQITSQGSHLGLSAVLVEGERRWLLSSTLPSECCDGREKLRECFIRDEDETERAYNEFSNAIPVISLAGIDEEEVARGLEIPGVSAACEEWGISRWLTTAFM